METKADSNGKAHDMIDRVELLELRLAQERVAKIKAELALAQREEAERTEALVKTYKLTATDQVLLDGSIKRGATAATPAPAALVETAPNPEAQS